MGRLAAFAALAALAACASADVLPPRPRAARSGVGTRLVRGAGAHMCLRDESIVTCWGMNPHGQLATTDLVVDPPAVLSSTAADVALGGDATCIVDRSGVVSCTGEVPFDLRTQRLTPLPELRGVVRIAVSSTALCTQTTGGVACRGRFDTGLLGPGVIHDSRELIPIVGLAKPKDLVVSSNLACIRTDDYRVICWGQPWNGIRRGFAPPAGFVASDTPAEITALRGATAIALGNQHACALVDGRAVCWGGNVRGQLGGSALEYDFVPRPVWDLEGLAGIAAGGDHTCAWDERGRAFCWGNNDYGQLGNGAMGPVFPPSRVTGLEHVVAVTAGTYSTCAETGTGEIWCWGSDGHGQALVRPRKIVDGARP